MKTKNIAWVLLSILALAVVCGITLSALKKRKVNKEFERQVIQSFENDIELQRQLAMQSITNNTECSYYTHAVFPEETICDIANMYGVSQKEIMSINKITDGAHLKPGTVLMIPIKN
ncbi:LysM peptidoglycan-binding domain-containing protein [Tichowtungia aerotolerans]|uniref:LysM peptidoglycan-binding domain-containing protein n=1 Tax=Tichowtungia aerotolerans TaxID=2697043 RepID=A0A6P1M1G9_9BACT|nr:LysM domain-containing protein [Tichowtungia aerotolerans]QHI68669.1 LysM peptidoglycan-binding domain-containing protein [Tichowtungia aerotolerans]